MRRVSRGAVQAPSGGASVGEAALRQVAARAADAAVDAQSLVGKQLAAELGEFRSLRVLLPLGSGKAERTCALERSCDCQGPQTQHHAQVAGSRHMNATDAAFDTGWGGLRAASMTPRSACLKWILTALVLLIGRAALASPPTAPTNLAALGVSSNQVRLTWTAATDNQQITGYVIERCTGAGCTNFAQVGTLASGTVYMDSPVSPSTTYQYEVYATDSTGAGPVSNVASATTLPTSVASSITYAYDALGRLVQANVAAISTVENYTYDAAGNLLSITAEPTSTLAISDLSSPEGAPGSTITIVGSGFSTNPSADIVTINGVAATVVSATTTQLVIDIPAGAASGPIEVQTGTSSGRVRGSLR